jgi:hypothetical protein
MPHRPHGPSHDDTARRFRLQAAYDRTLSIQNDKAVQVVAGQASDLNDCVELLAMLGLDARASRPGYQGEPGGRVLGRAGVASLPESEAQYRD